jgi:hypothetical protein
MSFLPTEIPTEGFPNTSLECSYSKLYEKEQKRNKRLPCTRFQDRTGRFKAICIVRIIERVNTNVYEGLHRYIQRLYNVALRIELRCVGCEEIVTENTIGALWATIEI